MRRDRIGCGSVGVHLVVDRRWRPGRAGGLPEMDRRRWNKPFAELWIGDGRQKIDGSHLVRGLRIAERFATTDTPLQQRHPDRFHSRLDEERKSF